MADHQDKQSDSGFSDTAPGGRQNNQAAESDNEDVHNKPVDRAPQRTMPTNSQLLQQIRNPSDRGNGRPVRGLTKQEVEEVSGSLKIHVKLNLEVDLRVQASLNGDLVVGIL
ncbi:uncharacterized protein Z518_02465 [Rhinocladiella mackenziei CBS 650.93]|uniref:Rhinocladiella mackenziei CBS 650.93 unplaced genomic scaffold supercont1.2, whole genome shotgun sequence n=1 Tax=Rhinocladiella mackenziei CBS 650.93 TaxID=1442369 RepID=A0A0D2IWQ1_9EURO|nr:uncharacterized protein Z518_02465 [Rhinocladiella mackenziei CBS 650.93]KIX07811.1 hypothetical protein Z518_02465 [Rhinocladiella mackenziei CBS 650.93]